MAEIVSKIVRDRSGRIAAARVCVASAPSVGTDRPAAVAVLNEAFAKVATQLALWAARVF